MATQGSQGFGSFMSGNVEEMLLYPGEFDKFVKIPDIVRNENAFIRDSICDLSNPSHVRDSKLFLLDLDNFTFVNHGAFGAAFAASLRAAQAWQEYVEMQPLRFIDRELLPLLVHVTKKLSTFLGCDPSEVVLTQNVTTALNSVIKSLPFQRGDRFVYTEFCYGGLKKLLKSIAKKEIGLHLSEINFVQEQYFSKSMLLIRIESHLRNLVDSRSSSHLKVYFLVSHIASSNAIVMPIEEIVKICRDIGVVLIVDGAHAPGALPLSFAQMKPDFYAGNCHKWMCNPKGAAFLRIESKEYRSIVKPVVTSHGEGSGFLSSFIWQGLQDYSPMLALLTTLEWWNIHGDTIRHAMKSILLTGVDVCVKSWRTDTLVPIEESGPMALVGLPSGIARSLREAGFTNVSDADVVQNWLYHVHRVEVPVKTVRGKLYVRLSAHIYNLRSDYERLARVVLNQICIDLSES